MCKQPQCENPNEIAHHKKMKKATTTFICITKSRAIIILKQPHKPSEYKVFQVKSASNEWMRNGDKVKDIPHTDTKSELHTSIDDGNGYRVNQIELLFILQLLHLSHIRQKSEKCSI